MRLLLVVVVAIFGLFGASSLAETTRAKYYPEEIRGLWFTPSKVLYVKIN